MLFSLSDVNAKGSNGALLIHKAVSRKNISVNIIETLIIQGVFSINVRSRYNMTPLHYAAMSGYEAMAEMLVRWGADLEARLTPPPNMWIGGHFPLTPWDFCDNNGYGWCNLLGTDGLSHKKSQKHPWNHRYIIQVLRVTTRLAPPRMTSWVTWLAARCLTARSSPSPTSRRWWRPRGRRRRPCGELTASSTMWLAVWDPAVLTSTSACSGEPGIPTDVLTVKVRIFSNDFRL